MFAVSGTIRIPTRRRPLHAISQLDKYFRPQLKEASTTRWSLLRMRTRATHVKRLPTSRCSGRRRKHANAWPPYVTVSNRINSGRPGIGRSKSEPTQPPRPGHQAAGERPAAGTARRPGPPGPRPARRPAGGRARPAGRSRGSRRGRLPNGRGEAAPRQPAPAHSPRPDPAAGLSYSPGQFINRWIMPRWLMERRAALARGLGIANAQAAGLDAGKLQGPAVLAAFRTGAS